MTRMLVINEARGRWERGDVVAVREDSHVWSANEGPPRFERVFIPDATSDEVGPLTQGRTEKVRAVMLRVPSLLVGRVTENKTVFAPRAYTVDLDGMTRNPTTGELDTTRDALGYGKKENDPTREESGPNIKGRKRGGGVTRGRGKRGKT